MVLLLPLCVNYTLFSKQIRGDVAILGKSVYSLDFVVLHFVERGIIGQLTADTNRPLGPLDRGLEYVYQIIELISESYISEFVEKYTDSYRETILKFTEKPQVNKQCMASDTYNVKFMF